MSSCVNNYLGTLPLQAFYTDGSWGAAATTSIFIAAAITDWLDGYIGLKLMSFVVCTKPLDVAIFDQVPWLLTVPSIIIIGREITISAIREWAASQNSKFLEAVAVNNLGKWKTATQMTALIILLATRDSRVWHSFALHFGWTYFLVLGRVYGQDMESTAEVMINSDLCIH